MKILLGFLLMALPIVASPQGMVKIPLKTPLQLSVDEPLSSKTATAGAVFKLVVADDVAVDGHVVIAKGAPATGRIVTSEKKARTVGNGKLEITIDSVKAVDGHTVPLDGRLTVGGEKVGFGHMGKDAEIKKGQVINAVVAAETEVKI